MEIEQEDEMPGEAGSVFSAVIQEHLELQRRNAALENQMPLDKYMPDDPFENHPLFKTEEQARVEDTLDGVASIVDEPTFFDWPMIEDTFIDRPAVESVPEAAPEPVVLPDGPELPEATVESSDTDLTAEDVSDEQLWSRSRDFDWGD